MMPSSILVAFARFTRRASRGPGRCVFRCAVPGVVAGLCVVGAVGPVAAQPPVEATGEAAAESPDAAPPSPPHHLHHEGPAETHHGGMRHDFSEAERWAEMFDDPERDVWQKPAHVVELMEVTPGLTVADLGAGTGYFLPWIVEAVGDDGRVLALDPQAEMVAWMEDRAAKQGLATVEVREIPYDDPGLSEQEADRVLVVNTWHHIGDRHDYVGRLCRALAPGGELWVVDFTKQSPHGPPVAHRLSAAEVVEELRAGGLEPEVVEEDLPHQWVVLGRRPPSCPAA